MSIKATPKKRKTSDNLIGDVESNGKAKKTKAVKQKQGKMNTDDVAKPKKLKKSGGKTPGKKAKKMEGSEAKENEVEQSPKTAKRRQETDKKAKLDKKKPLKDKVKAKQDLTKAELREKKKKLRDERRKKDKNVDVFDLSSKAKHVWEEVRRDDCSEEKRKELLAELHSLIKGQVAKIIYAHDTVRVVECLVAMGDEQIRDDLYNELKDQLLALAKSKYANFFVQKLVRYGSKDQRSAVFKAFEGRIAELTKHKMANTVVELCYNDYCKAGQRNRFLQEFFGPEFRHFKEDDARTVVDVMKRHPEKERDIMKNLAANVHTLLTKGCYNISLVHTVLYNYMIGLNHQLETGSANAEAVTKSRTDFITQLRDVCVHIVHSHDGARLTMNAIWHGSAKDRKAIVKCFKTFVAKIAMEEHGHLALMAIIDQVDDTKLTGKAIIGELTQSDEVIANLVDSEAARKVLAFVFVGRSTVYFHPDYLANLAKGDGNSGTKKDASARRTELAAALVGPLFEFVGSRLSTFLSSNQKILFLGGLLLAADHSHEKVRKVLSKIAEKVTEPFVPGDGDNLVELPAVHTLLKKLVKIGNFHEILLENLEPETIKAFLECNRGAFLLVAIAERDDDGEAKSRVKTTLEPYLAHLKRQTNKGATILREKLA